MIRDELFLVINDLPLLFVAEYGISSKNITSGSNLKMKKLFMSYNHWTI